MLSLNVLYMDLMNYMIMLCSFMPFWVFMVLGWQLWGNDGMSSHKKESFVVEFFWTVFPTAAVVVLCFLKLQCMSHDTVDLKCHMVKITGRQWYWSYDICSTGEYDSVMLDFLSGVDKPLRLLLYDFHRLMITSSDVMHSFSVPDFNMKVDAMPGRLNAMTYCPDHYGVFVGYCTELCGAGHAYMPIVIEVVNRKLSWE